MSILKMTTGLLASASLLMLAGPVFGEIVATLPPLYPRVPMNPQTEWGLPYEEVAFSTSGKLTLRGWFIPAEQPRATAVLYAPATAKDQRSGLSLIPTFHAAGYHVLLFSYRGHARSDGNSLGFTYGKLESDDVDAAVRFLRDTKGVRHIAAIGHSAGAASIILSAARNPDIEAVVAVAPYTCVADVWSTNRPALVPAFILDWTLRFAELRKGFDREGVCPLAVIDRIAPRPLLLIHGTGDKRITEAQVRRLYAAAQQPKALWLVQGATHGSIRTPVLDQLAPEVIAFLEKGLRQGTLDSAQSRPAISRAIQ